MSQRLSQAVEGIQAAVERVDSGQGALGVLSRDEEVAADLKELTAHLRTISARLTEGEGTAGRLLTDDTLHQRLDSIADRLDRTLTSLDEGKGTAGRLLHDEELYRSISTAVEEVRSLVADVRKDPRKYLRVKVSLF